MSRIYLATADLVLVCAEAGEGVEEADRKILADRASLLVLRRRIRRAGGRAGGRG